MNVELVAQEEIPAAGEKLTEACDCAPGDEVQKMQRPLPLDVVSSLDERGIDVVAVSLDTKSLRMRFRRELTDSERRYLLTAAQPAKVTFLNGDTMAGIVVVLDWS
jgi:hypothetical protein